MMRFLIVLVYFLVAWQSCAHSPPIPAPPQNDAGAGDAVAADANSIDDGKTIYASTCAHLAVIGCEDGKPANCASVLKKMVEGRITSINLPCLNASKDVTSARKCGGVKCTASP